MLLTKQIQSGPFSFFQLVRVTVNLGVMAITAHRKKRVFDRKQASGLLSDRDIPK